MNESDARQEIVKFARSLFERGFSVGSAGNISMRVGSDYLVTPTNSCLGLLDADRISFVDHQGQHLAGDPPSKEWPLHSAFYRTRPEAGAVVHLHSTYATALSCLTSLDPANCIAPLTPYVVMRVGRVALIPYARPGHPDLGEWIEALNGRHAAVLLANHGSVVAGKDLESAIYAAEELEETAKLLFLLQDRQPRLLTPEQVDELDRTFRTPKPQGQSRSC